MKKYRKKEAIVEAVQFTGKNQDEIKQFTNGEALTVPMSMTFESAMKIPTFEGDLRVQKGDFVIKGVEGDFYPCKPSLFKRIYEEA